jgi:uncharacterized OB-fold protein
VSGATPAYVPALHGLAAEYYRLAATTGRVHFRRCDACGAAHHPPRYYCPACASSEVKFAPSAGHGSVHSAVVAHRVFGPAPVAEVPYVAVVVELDEGPRILGVARGVPPGGFVIGQRVRIEVEPVDDAYAAMAVHLDETPATP